MAKFVLIKTKQKITSLKVSMTRKYHNQRPHINLLHREEETQTIGIHRTEIIQTMSSSQASLPMQDD